MKGRQIVLGRLFGAEAAALLDEGRLIDLFVDAGDIASLTPGDICRGTVERLMKGQGGVFVRLPEGQRGYLRDRSGLAEGQSLLVQVAGVAEDGKAIPLTARILFRGRHVLVTPGAPGINVSRRIRDEGVRADLTTLGESAGPPAGTGIIFRSLAETAPLDEIEAEMQGLLELCVRIMAEGAGPPELLLGAPTPHELAWMEWTDPEPDSVEQGDDSLERCGVLEAVDMLLSPDVALPGGGHAAIQPTRALVAIDVNTGSDTSPAAALKANIALARDLPRQLRLRGLGGQVVIDFAPIPKRDRATLDQVLRAAFKSESAETSLIGWTTMGLYEINRKRDRIPLHRLSNGDR